MQVLIAYYPSGVDLDVVRDWLAEGILELRTRWGLDSLHVVGHSMGGLIARSLTEALIERQQGLRVRSLTTINSPMGGLRSARTGVARAPIVIPSWRALAAGSDYLDRLSRWTQPKDVPYFLVFTYRTGSSGDGVVPLSSQIPLWVQAEASVLRGFESEHGLALHDTRTIEFITERLSSVESGEEVRSSRPGGSRSPAGKSD
jgi:pimeloyl-ACP methyl ester carboxylesterase